MPQWCQPRPAGRIHDRHPLLPNTHKIILSLEEAGLDYRTHPVSIGKGDQFQPEFLAISPNNRLPADFDAFPHLHRWHQAIAMRPATQRAYALGPTVNPDAGKPLSEEERRQLFGRR